MTSTTFDVRATAAPRRLRLRPIILGVVLALALALAGVWVAVDRTGGGSSSAITTDGVPLWPPLTFPTVGPTFPLTGPGGQTITVAPARR